MSVASVNEISAVSPDGFEAVIREALDRANKTLRNIQGAWVKDMNVMIEDGNIIGYKVNLEVTFVLEEYFGWHYRSRQRPAGDRDPHAGSGPLTLGSDGSHGTRPKPKT